MKTISLKPLVFAIDNFFTEIEADYIIKEGSDHLVRSPVDSPEAQDGYHADRTSFTAFLDDTAFTRDFRIRTAKLARLPSPSFTERMQLVRYQVGQFFRQHEDYFASKDFLDVKSMALTEFKTWTEWAAKKISELGQDVPLDFRFGGPMYPNSEDTVTFQLSILRAFLEDAKGSNFFLNHGDLEWGKWIQENVDNGAAGILDTLLSGNKDYMLQHIIKSWEKRINIPELKYRSVQCWITIDIYLIYITCLLAFYVEFQKELLVLFLNIFDGFVGQKKELKILVNKHQKMFTQMVLITLLMD